MERKKGGQPELGHPPVQIRFVALDDAGPVAAMSIVLMGFFVAGQYEGQVLSRWIVSGSVALAALVWWLRRQACRISQLEGRAEYQDRRIRELEAAVGKTGRAEEAADREGVPRRIPLRVVTDPEPAVARKGGTVTYLFPRKGGDDGPPDRAA